MAVASAMLCFGGACGSTADKAAERERPMHELEPTFFEATREIAAHLEQAELPGLAIAVVLDGQLTFSAGLGVKRRGEAEPVTPRTMFRLGSTTKMLIAATLLDLVERGLVSLDDRATDRVSYLKLAQDPGSIAVRHLLSHRSGIGDSAALGDPCLHGDNGLRTWFEAHSDLQVLVPSDTIFNYSNVGYGVVAAIIEGVTGNVFTEEVRRRIMRPAGMAEATFEPSEAAASDHATGHAFGTFGGRDEVVIDDVADSCAMNEAAGGALSSVEDFAYFVETFVGDGEGVLSRAAKQSMSAAHTPTGWGDGYTYGFGLYGLSYKGVKVLMHGGQSEGYTSYVAMVPSERFGVVLMANAGRDSDLAFLWSQSLREIDRFLGLEGPAPDHGRDPSTWEDYVGTYHCSTCSQTGWDLTVQQDPSGELSIVVTGAAGTLGEGLLSPGVPWASLVGGDTFSFHFDRWNQEMDLTFWRDATGAVRYLAHRSFVAVRVEYGASGGGS